ncbi:MAG: hypothetical protein NNA23_08355 [Nitrospira sp.]|nr:hypothetical protein [Nitrospira sp.]MCP9465635.1 hypothetical protein [Nitrospira sp.]
MGKALSLSGVKPKTARKPIMSATGILSSLQRMTEGADEVFVNGDSLIPGAQSLDPIFKERMFTGVQV